MAIDDSDVYERVGVIYRPAPLHPSPTGGPRLLPAGMCSGFYTVVYGDRMVLAYHVWFFRSPSEVMADLLSLMARGESGPLGKACDADFAIWRDGRCLGFVHHPAGWNEEDPEPEIRSVCFNDWRTPEEIEEGFYDEAGELPDWLLREWPDRDEWLAIKDEV